MQDGLVGKRAVKSDSTVTLMDNGQFIEPLGPFFIQVSFEPDLVDFRVGFFLSSVIGALFL